MPEYTSPPATAAGPPGLLRLPALIDERRPGRFQFAVALLCGLVMLLDGFDTQAINYMAPAITRDWGISTGTMSTIFSAALVGLMIGYLLLAPLSDKFGHKRLVLAGVAVFSLSTLLSVWVRNPDQLLVLRLVTGIGLGMATPSTIALTAEYSPKRARASFVLAIYCGFSLGFVAANYAADWLIPMHGWRSVFLAGAILPLILLGLLTWRLPESLAFHVRRGETAKAYALCRRIDRRLPDTTAVRIEAASADPRKRVKLSELLSGRQLFGTVLLWVVFAVNLAMFYGLQSWMPTVLHERGYSAGTLATASSMTTIGGIAIAFLVGPAMDRLGAYGALATLYLSGCGFLALMSAVLGAPAWLVLVAIFLIGCSVSGGQKSVIALAAVFYPEEVRSTGVGWALGIGRVGGILGPLIVGGMLSAGWSHQQLFLTLAIPSAFCGLIVLYLGLRAKKSTRT
ncbi:MULTISPECIES: MFS transporter [Amycolatopsis]|uniref:AAHS family 4-hydroxybenzoate transporter-like MFS transporter n=1 Tax=Amycolatopsis echigonensis TaxID=2576905 RepID=A0A2N3WNC3_9PSEU|nr:MULTISPECIES: aromatic acid/H+ symport family MFS transporter [Amycolatopsis]MBB2498323.1 aromatic acid/H+ symport family MFS transporter [Amycolatopsis echigonensis]PKV95365.1 AAHS family 4-hydroxybenzoate transporter-like MFS transporter [Amycolatopsis niigatensis]